jgi:hypothetical protein
MPTKETILKVFVSSPSDVSAERSVVVEVMEEINRTWATFLGVRFEPILWETHCRPGQGSDPQQVINEQIPENCDIYLGILWKLFGTPTPRFGSGTEEEFHSSYKRHKKHPKKTSVLFYFKNEPVPPAEIDPDSLAKINQFRKSLGPMGVLYWNFGAAEEFRQLVRIHLSRELQQWNEQLQEKCKSAPEAVQPLLQIDLELLQRKSSDQATQVFSLIGQAVNSLDHYFAELDKVLEGPPNKFISRLARATESYTKLVTGVADGFAEKIETATETWVDLFIAELLLFGSYKRASKNFISYPKDLAELFETQAKRYRGKMFPPSELLKVQEFQPIERRMQKVHSIFADEMQRAAKILRETQHIAQALAVKRRKLRAKRR